METMESSELVSKKTERTVRSTASARNILRSLFAEFLGVLIFVYIGCMSATLSNSLVAVGLAHGFTIMYLIVAFGHLSGGHFNPAVTLGILISNNIGLITALLYVVAQLCGGIVGAGLVWLSIMGTFSTGHLQGANIPNLQFDFDGQSKDGRFVNLITCEMVMTFILVITVLCSAVDKNGSKATTLAPFAIGMTIAVDIFAGGNLTGASMNPARSLGPAVVQSLFNSSSNPWAYHYICWAGPLLGGTIAGLIYRFLLKTE